MTNRQTHHGVAKGMLGSEVYEAEGGGDDQRTYKMAFPTRAGPRPCPVEGCSFRAFTQTATRMHFWLRHVRDTVVILEEVSLHHPR